MSKAILPGGGPDGGEFLFYLSEDGAARVEVRVLGDTVWLSLTQLAGLFDRDKSVISRHILNVFEEGELERGSVVAEFATTAADGKVYRFEHFNLDVIISVGYRVKSLRGKHFRIWATQRLREFIVKGFTMDDARLKAAGGGNHFDELLARIRDIRSSERVFWRKVLDIYATSEDSVFARYLNVPTKTLQSWEQGARTPKAGEARLLQFFDVVPDQIVRIVNEAEQNHKPVRGRRAVWPRATARS